MNDDLNEKLINSAWNGKLDTINILLTNSGSDVNYLTINNFSALTLAAWNGHLNIVKTLLENDFNFVEKYGWPKIIHQFTLKILFLIKNLLKVTLFSVKIL